MFEDRTVGAFLALTASKIQDGIRAENLVRVCADAGGFDVQLTAEALDRLLDEGVFETVRENGRMTVALGETGRTILPELAPMLPPSLTEAAARAAGDYAALERGVYYRARVEQTDGAFCVIAGSYTDDGVVCEVRLTVTDEKKAYAAKANFDAHPEKTLANIAAMLSGDMEFLL